jgi:GT2 family glycosyltransferase
MKASVIILSWNGMDYLSDCLIAVLSQSYPDFEVIVVDNGSIDGSADLVAEQFPQVQLVRNGHNLGFAAGNNVGLRAATGDVLVLLNQDTVVHDGWLAELVAALDDPTVGIVGCKLLYPDGTIQHAGAYLHGVRGESEHIGRREPDIGQYDKPGEVDFVTGASIALKRSTLVRIGPLDEGFTPAYYEDTDWCYRARSAGLRIVYWPAATVTHFESVSTQTDSYAHKAVYHHGRLRLLFKHKSRSWLQQELLPAETDWAGRLGRVVEIMAVRDAYLRIVLSLSEILVFRLRPEGIASGQDLQTEWDALLKVVSELRAVCIQDEPLGAAFETWENLWSDLQARWDIKERPFHSDAPIVGGGIAAFRHAWNSVSTRWYVLPILQQQIDFNSTVVNLMNALRHSIQQTLDSLKGQRRDVAQNMREIDTLARQVAHLQKRIEAWEELETEGAVLENDLPDASFRDRQELKAEEDQE